MGEDANKEALDWCMGALVWLPVIALPLSNVILAVATDAECDTTHILPWMAGAVAEELLYRWLLLRTLLLRRTRLRPTSAILLVSIVFACMHLWNLQASVPLDAVLAQLFLALCFSVWAGAVVWRMDQVWIPLLAHVLLNATAMAESMWVSVLVGAVVLADGAMVMKGSVGAGEHGLWSQAERSCHRRGRPRRGACGRGAK